GDQVPAPSGVYQPVGFDAADPGRAVVRLVFEAEPVAVAAGRRDGGERAGVDGGTRARGGHGGAIDGVHPLPKPGREHLLQLHLRSYRRFLDAGDGAAGGGAQAYRDGYGLLVVEQQRWQRGTGAEAVAAAHPWRGVNWVAEAAQLLHVGAHGARADPQ